MVEDTAACAFEQLERYEFFSDLLDQAFLLGAISGEQQDAAYMWMSLNYFTSEH